MTHKGTLYFTNQETGNRDVTEIDLPIETYIGSVVWGMDMLRWIRKFHPIRKWLLQIVLGKYAYRELVGLKESIVKHGYSVEYEPPGEGTEYYRDKVTL